MPAIPYILGGESVTASRMNTLFEELDRKTAIALDGHALAWVLAGNSTHFVASTTRDTLARWMTNCFAFGAGRNVSAAWTDAEHTEADLTATPIRAWHQAELIFDGKRDYDFPAHYTRFNFFRIHNANAETLTVRFKNTDGTDGYTATVPAYGSRCVRRTAVDGTYTEGFRYFQKFLPGDVHTYCQGGPHGISNNVVAPQTLLPFVHLLAGDNISNGGTGGGSIRAVWALDVSVRAPLPARSAELYGDASDENTLIGDLLHHAGGFWDLQATGLGVGGSPEVTKVARQFNGYATIDGDMTAQGITVTRTGDDLTLTAAADGKQHDAVSTGTNLFSTGQPYSDRPVRDLSAGVTLDRHVPNRAFTSLATTTGTQAASYSLVAPGGGLGAAVNFTFDGPAMTGGATGGECSIVPHRDKTGHTIETLSLKAGEAATANSTYRNAAFTLSSTGLWLTAEHVITPQAVPALFPYFWPALAAGFQGTNTRFSFHATGAEAGYITETRGLCFTNYGWPNDDEWQDYANTTGFFIPPGAPRYYGMVKVDGTGRFHPDFDYTGERDIAYTNTALEKAAALTALTPLLKTGNEFFSNTLDRFTAAFKTPGVLSNVDVLRGLALNLSGFWYRLTRDRLLTNTKGIDNLTSYPAGLNGDGVYGDPAGNGLDYLFHRVPMAAEHFNNLAAKVNSITHIRPLNFTDHGWFPGFVRPVPGGAATVSINDNAQLFSSWPVNIDNPSAGRQGAGIVPMDCFGVVSGDFATALTTAGLLRGVADLPASYHAAHAAFVENRTITLDTIFATDDDVQPDTFLGAYIHTMHYTVSASNFTVGPGIPTATPLLTIDAFPWCKISELRTYAEANGWKFIHQTYGAPLSLEVVDCSFAIEDVIRQSTETVRIGGRGNRNFEPNPYTGTNAPWGASFTLRSKFPHFTEDADGEWLAVRPPSDDRNYFILCSESAIAPDVMTIHTGGKTIVQIEAPEAFRRRWVETSFGVYASWWIQFPSPANPSGVRAVISVQRPVTDDVYTTKILLRDHSSESIPKNHKAMLIPCDSVAMVESFSRTSGENAWARRQTYGASVLPFERIPASGETIILSMEDEAGDYADLLLTGYNGRRAVFLVDNLTAV